MTTNHRPNPEPRDDDAVFADLAASMPELAAIDDGTLADTDLEEVTIEFPDPSGRGVPFRMTLAVPTDMAAMIEAEFSPERVAAMMQAFNAMALLALPPQR